MTTVTVTFWQGENSILNWYEAPYPSFCPGDDIYLEIRKSPNSKFDIPTLRLTKFKIQKIVAYVCKDAYANDIATTCTVNVHIEQRDSDGDGEREIE